MKTIALAALLLLTIAACTPIRAVKTGRGTISVQLAPLPAVTIDGPEIAPNELSLLPTVTPTPEVTR